MSFDENIDDKFNRRDFPKKAAAIGLGATVGGTALGRPIRLQPRSPFLRRRCPAGPSAGRA
jgi:hypothetical protein